MAANTYTTYGVADGPSEAGLVRVIMEGEALAQPSEEEVSETIPAERFEHGRASLVAEPYPGTARVWRGSEDEANILDESEWTVEGATITIWELASDPVALVEWETLLSRELTDADFSGGRAALMGEPSSVTLTEDGEPVPYELEGSVLVVEGMGGHDGLVRATYSHTVELTLPAGTSTLPDAPESVTVTGRTLGESPSEEPAPYVLDGSVLTIAEGWDEYAVTYSVQVEEGWSLSEQVREEPAPDSEEGEEGTLEPTSELVGHVLQWDPEGLSVTLDGEPTTDWTLDGRTVTVGASGASRTLSLECSMPQSIEVPSSALRASYELPTLPSGEVSVTVGGEALECTAEDRTITVPSLWPEAARYVVRYSAMVPQGSVEMPCAPVVQDGESVVVTVVNGSPMVTAVMGSGDAQQGQLDDAATIAVEAAEAVDSAVQAAEEAQEIASAVGQHVWSDANGEHVTEATMDEFLATPTGRNILMNAAGILLRDALVNLLQLSRSGMAIYDGQGNDATNVVAQFTQNLISLSPQPESGESTASIELFDGQGLIECIFGQTRSRLNLSAGSTWLMGYDSSNLTANRGSEDPARLGLSPTGLVLDLQNVLGAINSWGIDGETLIISGPGNQLDTDRIIDLHVDPTNGADYDVRLVAASDGTNFSVFVRNPADTNEVTQFYLFGGAAGAKGRIMQRTSTDGGTTWRAQHGVRSPWTSLGSFTGTGNISYSLAEYEEVMYSAKANGKLVTATVAKQLLTSSAQELWLGGGKSANNVANAGNLRAVINVSLTGCHGINFAEGSADRTSSTTWNVYAR